MSVNQRFTTTFWQWYFSLSGFEDITDETTYVAYEDIVTDTDGQAFIDFESEKVTCANGDEVDIKQFIAILEGLSLKDAEDKLKDSFEEFQKKDEDDLGYSTPFVLDENGLSWHKQREQSAEQVTDFDIRLTEVIARFNRQTNQWQRTLKGFLRFWESGKIQEKEFELDPESVRRYEAFSSEVWQMHFLRVMNMKDHEVRNFFVYLNRIHKPKQILEYDHWGFIYFNGYRWFLAENALVQLYDSNGEPEFKIIGPDENGAFPVSDNQWISPPEEAQYLPFFENLDYMSSQHRYINSEQHLYEKDQFESEAQTITQKLCSTVGGGSQDDFQEWGKLLMGYVVAQFFYEDIFKVFRHIVYIYLVGEGNTGKGKVAEVLLSFFGQPQSDLALTPTPRYVDIALEQHSQIPAWIDEHIPERQELKSKVKIPDQFWNGWFELKPRSTSTSVNFERKQEKKVVRSMALFASNYRPVSDHLLSRCLILEYTFSRRGPYSDLEWLLNSRARLQRWFLSFLSHANKFDQKAYRFGLQQSKELLRNEAEKQLEQDDAVSKLKDRQIESYAILMSSYLHIYGSHRQQVNELQKQYDEACNAEDNQTMAELTESFRQHITGYNIFDFCLKRIISGARTENNADPMAEFLETVALLVEQSEINGKHYSWDKHGKGTLKIWWSGIWNIYAQFKKGMDMANKDTIEQEFKEMMKMAPTDYFPTVNWTDYNSNIQRRRGIKIENAHKDPRLRNAFKYDAEFGINLDEQKQQNGNTEDEKPNQTEVPF